MIPYRVNAQYLWANYVLVALLVAMGVIILMDVKNALNMVYGAIYLASAFFVLCVRPWAYVFLFGFMLVEVSQLFNSMNILLQQSKTLDGMLAALLAAYLVILGLAIFLRSKIYWRPDPEEDARPEKTDKNNESA